MIVDSNKEVKIYSDGASRGNPGPAAYGFIFIKDNEVNYKESGFIGKKTNNQAEYIAVLNALKKARERKFSKIKYFSDSQLLVKQLNGEWNVRDKNLKKYYDKINELIREIDVDFSHVNRENRYIEIADALCNKKLDKTG